MSMDDTTVETTTRRVSGQLTKRGGEMAIFRYMHVFFSSEMQDDVEYWDMVPLDRAERPGTRIRY